MKVSELLEQRRQSWSELEQMCAHMENRRKAKMMPGEITRFAAVYRSVCADLALADAYQLPPTTIQYLHRLVGRAHNQLYRSRAFNVTAWTETLFREVPRRIFHDGCVQLAFCLFWGVFIAAAALAGDAEGWPRFAEKMVTEPMLDQLEDDFANPIQGRDAVINPYMASFYIRHNTGIGLQCFAGGLLVMPGLLITIFNAAHLGAIFGYMSRPDVEAGTNFFHFVTAHGPFELTAIVLSAGAGLRLGYSWVWTDGLTRVASLRRTAQYAMPLMGAAMVLFFLAALIEAFLSPSALPYAIKAAVAILSSGLITAYFILLGYPEEPQTVQQDRTRIVIRERSMIDILDLALRVGVTYLLPLLLFLLTAVLPLALINGWLVGWLVADSPDPENIARFIAAMVCLIIIEAPLASVFLTSFIGQAVFLERPRAREVFQSVLGTWWRHVWCQLIRRGILLAWILAYYIPQQDSYSAQEFFLLMLACLAMAVRSFRPFLNEIILLERNPLRTDDPLKLTIRRRSAALHGPSSSDLFGRWMAVVCVAIPLTLSVILSIWFCFGMLLFDWSWGPVMIMVCVPGAVWLVVGYLAVVRFLCYLDLRIRREGWEVDLIMAGAAARLGDL